MQTTLIHSAIEVNGLPAEYREGEQWIGLDENGNHYILRLDKKHGWHAIGWQSDGAPVVYRLAGRFANFIQYSIALEFYVDGEVQ